MKLYLVAGAQIFLMILAIVLIVSNSPCNENSFRANASDRKEQSSGRIKSGTERISKTEPGLAALMNEIQRTYSKLYYSLENENKQLAKYYLRKLKEDFDSVKAKYIGDKKYSLERFLLFSEAILQIDNLERELEKNETPFLKEQFKRITESCNSCHRKTNFSFIKITEPLNNSFSDQDFQSQ